MRFSQRIGLKPIKLVLEREQLSDELRNSLWTIFIELIINSIPNDTYDRFYGVEKPYSPLALFFKDLWIKFYKYPIDSLSLLHGKAYLDHNLPTVRTWYYKADWVDALDFIEFCSNYSEIFQSECNNVLQSEMSAYRFIDGILVEINSIPGGKWFAKSYTPIT